MGARLQWQLFQNYVQTGHMDRHLKYSTSVTFLGAGKAKPSIIRDCLTYAPPLIAVDNGAKNAFKLRRSPDFIIGDFDSIGKKTLSKIPTDRQLKITEQETTDFEKALKHVSAPLILAVGFLGKRLDHQLAALNALVKFADKPCILVAKRDIVFHLPATLDLNLKLGTRLSLFPLAPVQGVSSGLRWPIAGLNLSPTGRIGTSNITTQAHVHLEMQSKGMLCILPYKSLPAVIEALLQ